MSFLYKCKEFSKTGVVRLPKKYLSLFQLTVGDKVDIYYHSNRVIIEKAVPNSTHNSRYISENSTILIPIELRTYFDIKPNDEYCLYVNEQNEYFCLEIFH